MATATSKALLRYAENEILNPPSNRNFIAKFSSANFSNKIK